MFDVEDATLSHYGCILAPAYQQSFHSLPPLDPIISVQIDSNVSPSNASVKIVMANSENNP